MAKRRISIALREEWRESFADYIKTKRKRLGLTQLALAQRIGVNQTMISKLPIAAKSPGYELTRQFFPSCLGLTRCGNPRHPLYLPSRTEPTRWVKNEEDLGYLPL